MASSGILRSNTFKDQAEDVVTNGPSDNALRFGRSMYYGSNQFWDDGLTENEMDLICGVYKLYSKYRIFITAYFLLTWVLQCIKDSLQTFLGG